MTTERELNRVVRSWLELGPNNLPDSLLEDVRAGLVTTPQRRHLVPPRRVLDMHPTLRSAISAAAALAIAAAGLTLILRPSGISTPGPVASPTPSASEPRSTVPSLPAAAEGPLAAGRYTTAPFFAAISNVPLSFTVPAGYSFVPNWAILPSGTGSAGPNGAGIGFLQPNGLFSDPCHWDVDRDGVLEAGDVPTGTTVVDLVAALRTQTAYRVTVVGNVSLAGHVGQRVDLELPASLDLSPCDKPTDAPNRFAFVWGPAVVGAPDLYIQGPGNRWQVYALDVNGSRVVILIEDFAATPAATRADLEAIVSSITLGP